MLQNNISYTKTLANKESLHERFMTKQTISAIIWLTNNK